MASTTAAAAAAVQGETPPPIPSADVSDWLTAKLPRVNIAVANAISGDEAAYIKKLDPATTTIGDIKNAVHAARPDYPVAHIQLFYRGASGGGGGGGGNTDLALDDDARTLASYGLDGDGGDREAYSLQFVLVGPKTFTYEHDFDRNGILYYIGTGEGAGEPYVNPAEAGRIAVTRSAHDYGPYDNYDVGTANIAAGRTDADIEIFAPRPRWMVPFRPWIRAPRHAHPLHPQARRPIAPTSRLRNWVLEGWNGVGTVWKRTQNAYGRRQHSRSRCGAACCAIWTR